MAISDISDKLTALKQIQRNIRSEIMSKGVSISGDFSTYADAIRLLRNPQGIQDIDSNGIYDISDYAEVSVNVPQIETTSQTFTANGTYSADTGSAWDNITINVPTGGITPSGEIDITQNGSYDVTEKAVARVAVPVGVFPAGQLNITQNGVYDVTERESVNVSIPAGASPVFGQVSGSGSKTLTISAIAGKNNVAVFLISTTSSNLSISTITGAGFIDGTMYMTYKSSSNIMRLSTTASYNKTNGQIAYTGSNSYNFSNNANLKYMYVAW